MSNQYLCTSNPIGIGKSKENLYRQYRKQYNEMETTQLIDNTENQIIRAQIYQKGDLLVFHLAYIHKPTSASTKKQTRQKK